MPASSSTPRSRPIPPLPRIAWPRAGSGRRRTAPMPRRNARANRSCSATARGRWSENTRRARWSMAAMSASSGTIMRTPAARIPTVRLTRSCGTRSAGKRISIRPFFTETADNGPTLKAMRQGVIASLKTEKKQRGPEDSDLSTIEAIEPKLLKIGPVSLAPSTVAGKSSGLTFHYLALRGRLLCRRRLCRLRAVGDVEAVPDAGRRQDFRRRAAEGRRRPAAMRPRPSSTPAGQRPFERLQSGIHDWNS